MRILFMAAPKHQVVATKMIVVVLVAVCSCAYGGPLRAAAFCAASKRRGNLVTQSSYPVSFFKDNGMHHSNVGLHARAADHRTQKAAVNAKLGRMSASAKQQQHDQQPRPLRRREYKRKRGIPVTEFNVQQVASQRQEAYEKLCEQPASIWSFESLFPEPVWDTESIQKDLYRDGSAGLSNKKQPPPTLYSNNSTFLVSTKEPRKKSLLKMTSLYYGGSAMMRIWRDPNNVNKLSSSPSSSSPLSVPTITQPNPDENATLKKNTKAKSVAAPQATVLPKDNSAVIGTQISSRSGNTAQLQSSSSNNKTATGRVDLDLTRMVEDRVNGYRRLPNGDMQYETSLVSDGAIQFRDGVRLGNPLPINADILTYSAKKELQHGRVEEAAELYEKAVSTDPSDGRAYLGLSKCAERRRDFSLARKWLVQGITQSVVSRNNGPLAPDRGANPFLLQALGTLEEKLGHLTQAELLYKEGTKSRPSHAAAWVSLGVIRTRKLGFPVSAGRLCFQSAERELEVAGKPPSAYVYTSWANLEYHKAGDKTKARELFQKALKIDPKCSAAWLQLGVLEAACSNWEEAEVCFETVMKFDQRNSRVLQAYALMETKRPAGDSRKAIGLFERALQANPRDAGVLQPYALYVAQLGDLNAARDLLRRGTEVNKRHAAVWQAWGVLESRHGNPFDARNIFQQGIWACGQLTGGQSGGYHCARLWQAWGVLEAKEGQHAAARRCFSRALDANSRNVPAFTAWALMEEQLGNIKDARMIFERALKKFAPGSDDKMALWRSYEVMEQRLGEVEAAQNVYQRSVRETFAMKDESDLVSIAEKKPLIVPDQTQNIDDGKKSGKKNEFEVVRWESTGGEVWMNDRSIEAKIPMKNQRQHRKKQI